MKKKVCFIFIIFLIFSIELNARNINMPFENAKEVANNYIEGNFQHSYYLIKGDNLYFGFDKDNKIVRNDDFLKGGLVNLQEYKISFYKNNSYLKSGINYWTMTDNASNYYVITESKEKLNNINGRYEARISEYVKKDTHVSGSGTYKDPWVFNKLNTIVFVSTDESKGKVNPTKTYVLDGERLAIGVYPEPGYEYESNTCSKTLDASGGISYKDGEIKDDVYCEVSFKEKTYTVTYDNNGGSGCSNKQVTFNGTYGELCTPIKEGYTFMGWFNDDGTTQITKDTKVTNTPYAILHAKWKRKNIYFADINDNHKCQNEVKGEEGSYVFTYTGACKVVQDGEENYKVYLYGDQTTKSGEGILRFSTDLKLDFFLVGGGGASGKNWGGGGGGGYTNTFANIQTQANIDYKVQVGAGGKNGVCSNNPVEPAEQPDKPERPKTICGNGRGNSGEPTYVKIGFSTYIVKGGQGGECGNGRGWGDGPNGGRACKYYGDDSSYNIDTVYGGAGGSAGGYGYTNMYCDAPYSLSQPATKGRNRDRISGQGYSTCEWSTSSDSAGSCNSGIEYSKGGSGGCVDGKNGSANTGNGATGGGNTNGSSWSGGSGIIVFRNAR